MFDKIIRDATVPGAFMNALNAAQESSLEEKRRRGGYKVAEATVPRSRSVFTVIRERMVAVFSRDAYHSERQTTSD